jgi:iron-sulfur cluster repair protein YtfE (RIC family)
MQDQFAISAVAQCVLKPHHALLNKEVARAADLIGSVVVEQRPPLCRILLPLFRLFQEFRRSLEDHLEVQERRLFPRLIDLEIALQLGEQSGACADEVSEAMRLLKYGQIDVTNVLDEMRELTHSFVAPSGACECYGELLDVLASIQMEVASEIRMETNMLFEQAAELLEQARNLAAREVALGHALRADVKLAEPALLAH